MVVLYSSKTNTWKIADFGLTSQATTTQPITTSYGRGKPGYRAPELVLDPKQTYNKKVDIWSLGCILFELCTGRMPFASDGAVLLFAQQRAELVITLPDVAEPERAYLVALISRTLHPSPKRRPSSLLVQRAIQGIRHYQNTITSDSLSQHTSASSSSEIDHLQSGYRDMGLTPPVGSNVDNILGGTDNSGCG